jgi:xanthine dehydrogenase accessory factor
MPRDPNDSGEAAAASIGSARPATATAAQVLHAAASCASSGIRGAMATVLERHGSAPGTAGQKLYLGEDGTCVGTVGGGAIERATLETLRAVVADPLAKHAVRTFKLGAELGMCCGGQVEMLVEPIDGVVPCLVVGGGHVASALAPLLVRVGFAVTVVDAREGWGDEDRIPGVRCVQGEVDDADVDVDPRGVCLVMTHDHSLDQDAIEWALKRGFAFVGGVGSRAKAERTRQRLEAKGFPESDRARVRMPLGVDIGARLPDEIAVAIAAEMVAWRKKPRRA